MLSLESFCAVDQSLLELVGKHYYIIFSTMFIHVQDILSCIWRPPIRVLELGQVFARPFCGQLFGWIPHFFPIYKPKWPATDTSERKFLPKIEPPKIGDPLRVWRELDVDGTSPWFRSMTRNKKYMTIDMCEAEGREWVPSLTQPNNSSEYYYYYRLVKKLALKSDILLENLKPGTLKKWGFGLPSLYPYNPFLIFTCVLGTAKQLSGQI